MRSGLPALLAGVALAALCGLVAGVELIDAAALGVAVLTAIQIFLLVRARGRQGTVLHPCIVLGAVLAVYGWLGYLVYPAVADHGPMPLKSPLFEPFRALLVFQVFSVAPLLVAAVARRPSSEAGVLKIDLGAQTPAIRIGAISLLVLTAAAYVIGSDIPAMIHRDTYHGFTGSLTGAIRLGEVLLIPSLLVAWVLALSRRATLIERGIGFTAVFAFTLFDFATASRGLALVPLLFLLAFTITRGRLPSIKSIAVAGLISLAFFSSVLYQRTLDEQGVGPYVAAISREPGTALTSRTGDVTANLLAGFPTGAKTMEHGAPLDTQTFLLSIDPLPRSALGIEPGKEFRLTSYLPESTVGMLGQFSVVAGFFYFLVVGAIFAWLWTFGHRTAQRATIARPALIGLAMIVSLMAIEYQLRTTSRVVTTLAIVLPIVLFLFTRGDVAVSHPEPEPA
jgi:hypothetical protein